LVYLGHPQVEGEAGGHAQQEADNNDPFPPEEDIEILFQDAALFKIHAGPARLMKSKQSSPSPER
jgi:hypothetical protein